MVLIHVPAAQPVTLVILGAMLVALGLIPGPLAGLRDGILNFRDSLFSFPQRQPVPRVSAGERLPGQAGLAVAGAVLILIGLLLLVVR